MTMPGFARRALQRFRRQRRAVAAVEFAIIAPVLLVMLGGLVDTGMLEWSRSQLAVAVANGMRYAMLVGPTVTSAAVKTAVTGATTLSPVSVTVTGPSCFCATHSGTTTTLTSSLCTATCSNGYTAGKYVMITASYTYPPMMPLLSNIASTARSESATVRVQ